MLVTIYTVPVNENRYKCIVTGMEKYIPPTITDKKCKKFSSLDEFREHYVCPAAARLLRAGSTVEDVRKALSPSVDLPDVDIKILARLKLLRKKSGGRVEESNKRTDRENYLQSKEFQEKKVLRRDFAWASEQQYVEWLTGGPDNCQVAMGGTCQRPDIHVNSGHYCDDCSYYKYCLVKGKRVTKAYISK